MLNELGSLPDLPTSNSKKNNKQFKKSQPFWNQNLDSAWKDVCRAEKDYLNYKANQNFQAQRKNELHTIFKNCQNVFDRKFRYFKRKHRKQGFVDLQNSAQTNPSEMWAQLNRLSSPPTTRAALQIV